jgi:phage baseplate assembly protein gpV/phage protein D
VKAVVGFPGLAVEVDGRRLVPELEAALGEVQVRKRLGLPAQAELAFFSAGAGEGLVPEVGMALRMTVPGRPQPLFEGEVTAVELAYGGDGGLELRVRGYDLLHRLRKRRPLRAHVEVTVTELARELVADLGLQVAAAEAGHLRRRILQHRGSDLTLLAEEAAACGLYAVLRGSTLHLLTLEGEGDPVELDLGGNLLEARFELNAEPCCRTVAAAAWDPGRAELHGGRASVPRSGRRVRAEAPPARLGSGGDLTLAGETAASARQAEALAQAELDRRSAGEVVLRGVAEGDPRLDPGRPVEVAGVAADFRGRYVVTAVEHRVGAEVGFVSRIDTAPPAAPRRRTAAAAAWGTVSQVDDPEGLGRIKVALPAYGELESDWMEVVCAAAGDGKGLILLPDVGDQVLVLLVAGDPASGVVLGGLYGSRQPPDAGVDGASVERYTLLGPGGERLLLDAGKHRARLENGRGSSLDIAPGRVRLHAATDLVLEAPGRRVLIRGEAIDFERA